jgi:regulator of nonsense transcripts 2
LPPATSKPISATRESSPLALDNDAAETVFPSLGVEREEDELIEKEVRDRFKKMCEGYFENVAKKLIIEHRVCGVVGGA